MSSAPVDDTLLVAGMGGAVAEALTNINKFNALFFDEVQCGVEVLHAVHLILRVLVVALDLSRLSKDIQ